MYSYTIKFRLLVGITFIVSHPLGGTSSKIFDLHDIPYLSINDVFDAQLDDTQCDIYALPVSSSFKNHAADKGALVMAKVKDFWKLGIIVSIKDHELCDIMIHEYKKDSLKTVPASSVRQLYPLWSIIYNGLTISIFPEVFFKTLEQFSNRASLHQNRIYGQLMQPGSRIIIIGDIHGDFDSLGRNLIRLATDLKLINSAGHLVPNTYLVMLGDYADRVQRGCQCWYTLMSMALKNPGKVFLIRGNHETEKFSQLKKHYKPFLQEWEHIFSQEQVQAWWPHMLKIFQNLILGAVFGLKSMNYYDFIFLCHGGYATSWSPAKFIESIINKNKPLTIEMYAAQAQEFMNNDFVGLALHDIPKGHKRVRLHKEGKHVSWHEMRSFLRTHATDINYESDKQYCLRSIVRGHQHAEGGIVQLMPTVDQWRKLHHKNVYELDQYSVYSFTSSPLIYGKEDAFGILYASPTGRWYLTTYIYPV